MLIKKKIKEISKIYSNNNLLRVTRRAQGGCRISLDRGNRIDIIGELEVGWGQMQERTGVRWGEYERSNNWYSEAFLE